MQRGNDRAQAGGERQRFEPYARPNSNQERQRRPSRPLPGEIAGVVVGDFLAELDVNVGEALIRSYKPAKVASFSSLLRRADETYVVQVPGSCAAFSAPTPNGNQPWDLRQIEYVKPVKCSDKFKSHSLDAILLALVASGAPLRAPGGGPDPPVDFISFRNNFNKICKTPYQRGRQDEWEVHVHRAGGIVHLNIAETGAEPAVDLEAWGYRFEGLSTRPPANVPPEHDHHEFCIVVRASLGPYALYLGAEIDCFRTLPDPPPAPPAPPPPEVPPFEGAHQVLARGGDPAGLHDLRAYVELKSSMGPVDLSRPHSLRYMRWWVQSWLAGVPALFCGVHRDGLMHPGGLSRLLLSDLPDAVRRQPPPARGGGSWEPAVCAAFAARVLRLLKEHTAEGGSYTLRFSAEEDRVSLQPAPARPPFLTPSYLAHVAPPPPP